MSKRLLLVDDEATLVRAMGRLLRRAGYDVFLAGTCDEARRASGSFSLGVFDIDLPDGNGITLGEELTAAGTVRRAIFFSGTSDASLRARAAQLGVFIDKSRGFPTLYASIELALASQHAKVVGAEEARFRDSSDPPPSGVRENGKHGKRS
jgi:DNA-binding response OmpR family regulator